jgi:hypothetical protein
MLARTSFIIILLVGLVTAGPLGLFPIYDRSHLTNGFLDLAIPMLKDRADVGDSEKRSLSE